MVEGELHIGLLGGFSLRYKGEQVSTVNTPRLQQLLAYLVLHRDSQPSRQHLAFLFWPESTEKQALTNLRNLLHLQGLERRSKAKYVPPNAIAAIHLALGHTERVLDYLEQAYAVRDTFCVLWNVRTVYGPVRDEPRFQELLRRMNFPEP